MFATLKSSAWAYPTLEVIHILGISLLLGNLMLLELRVFGKGAALPIKDLARLGLSIVLVGFCMAVASGLLMFATQPEELLANRAFTLKILFLTCAACNAAWFHGRGSLDKLDAMAKAQMVVSTVLWVAIVTCGRWIAYR
jgi:hypothetical protein